MALLKTVASILILSVTALAGSPDFVFMRSSLAKKAGFTVHQFNTQLLSAQKRDLEQYEPQEHACPMDLKVKAHNIFDHLLEASSLKHNYAMLNITPALVVLCDEGNKIGLGDGAGTRHDVTEVAEGLLNYLSTEENIAAVLAHEIAHSTRFHFDRLELRLDLGNVEQEADTVSLSILRNAGYSPEIALTALKKIEPALGPASQQIVPRIVSLQKQLQHL